MFRKCGMMVPVMALASLAGCKEESTDLDRNSYRVTVEDQVAHQDLIVKHLTVTAHGERWVKITEEGGHDQARIDPDRETGLMTADILLVADLVSLKEPAKSQLTWLLQTKGPGVVVGGPTRVEVPPDAELSELVSVDIAPGDHPVAQDIRLGKVLDRELTLTVE